VIANISGFSIEEYQRACERIDSSDAVGLIEVNISCPNVHGGGMSFGASAKTAAEVTRAVKAVTKKPVYMKLSPNAAEIAEIAKACEDAGADGLSLINTLLGMARIDSGPEGPVLANRTGGLSGPAILPWRFRWSTECTRRSAFPSSAWGRFNAARRAGDDAGGRDGG
jgi:dihydroorotate dehydrogenase (NAD+) catalytic subunit